MEDRPAGGPSEGPRAASTSPLPARRRAVESRRSTSPDPGHRARHRRARIAREAAAEATLDLADRTCHELGNVAFVVANERRNLSSHIELLERFVAEDGAAHAGAARRAGLDPSTASRFGQALRREYAD